MLAGSINYISPLSDLSNFPPFLFLLHVSQNKTWLVSLKLEVNNVHKADESLNHSCSSSLFQPVVFGKRSSLCWQTRRIMIEYTQSAGDRNEEEPVVDWKNNWNWFPLQNKGSCASKHKEVWETNLLLIAHCTWKWPHQHPSVYSRAHWNSWHSPEQVSFSLIFTRQHSQVLLVEQPALETSQSLWSYLILNLRKEASHVEKGEEVFILGILTLVFHWLICSSSNKEEKILNANDVQVKGAFCRNNCLWRNVELFIFPKSESC